MAIRPKSIRVFAPAKINLFLHVTGKRADGFHELQSLAAFADVADELAVDSADSFSLEMDGPFAKGLPQEADNLVLRAARALSGHFGVRAGARFKLTKNLPVASGIGGGSADAAAAFRGLIALWKIGDTDSPDIGALAARLGSDIPVCLASVAAWMEGRGERVTRLSPLPQAHLVLINPGFGVATAEVFRRLDSRKSRPASTPPGPFASADDLFRYLGTTGNDLEAPALSIAPEIGTVLDALSHAGSILARMSGSGATCFGFFKTAAARDAAAASIARTEKAWWIRAAEFVSDEFARPHFQ